MGSELRAFCITNSDDEAEALIVFAESASKARKYYTLFDWYQDSSFLDTKVRREPKADKYARTNTPYLVWGKDSEREIYRQLGWRVEEESPCEECELYPCDMAKYALNENGLCPECSIKQLEPPAPATAGPEAGESDE